MIRKILLPLVVASAAFALLFASPVSAHNTLLSSDPDNGEVFDTAPTELTLIFTNSVPLDTFSVELIDASGVRSNLSGANHGSFSDTAVMTPLPALAPGAITLRWQLIGSDGHVITGRINFTVNAAATTPAATTPAATTPAATTPAATTPAAGTFDPTLAVPTTPPPLAAAPATSADPGSGFEERFSTSTAARWLLRFGSYVAIMTIAGVLATTAFVWSGAWDRAVIQTAVKWSLAATLFGALAQLLVIASDIKGSPPWASFGGISDALSTDAGVALAIRIGLVVALAWAIFAAHTASEEARWMLSAAMLILLLGTWAFAGHSRSMRWPLLGVPLDVAHHAAAAAWIGGLAIIGLVAIRTCDLDELIASLSRFAQLAATAVTVIVATGVVQAFRLVESPGQLFASSHGRYLLLKVFVLMAMLKVADVNRKRVNRRLRSASRASPVVIGNLGRAMGTELAVGLLIVALTAVMVVSPPAVAEENASANAALNAPTTTFDLAGAAATATTTTTPTDSAACVMSGSPVQLGATGPDVECLQQTLIATGFLVGAVTGTFDSATDAAVRSLQTQRGLEVDGIVGRITATAIGIWPTA